MTAQSASFTTEDVTYHTVDGAPLEATIYRPAGQPIAGVVEVHGGGWVTGDRFNNKFINEALARAGVVVMAIEFRAPPAVKYPLPIADINLAIRWFKANASKYGVPAGKVGGVATSSGAHQLLLATLRPNDPRYAVHSLDGVVDANDASVAFLVICWPVSDPLARFKMVTEKNVERLLKAHAAYFADEAQMSEANPQLLLERGEAALLPPALVLQGTNDDNLTPDMAHRLQAIWTKRGGEMRLELFEGEPHAFTSSKPESPAGQRAFALIQDFVRAQAGVTTSEMAAAK